MILKHRLSSLLKRSLPGHTPRNLQNLVHRFEKSGWIKGEQPIDRRGEVW